MRYRYIAACAIVGGVSLDAKTPLIELSRSESSSFFLVKDPDDFLRNIDEAGAISLLMLKGLIGERGTTEFDKAIDSEVQKIQIERRKIIGVNTVLIFQAEGDIVVSLNETVTNLDRCTIAFDAFDKDAAKQVHQSNMEAMKVAISLERDSHMGFVNLADGVFLLDDEEMPIYSFSISASAEISLSSALTDESIEKISSRYQSLNKLPDLDSVERLFSQMTDRGADRLKIFLSGWTALEILIAKSFKAYESEFLLPFTNAEQPSLRERFLGRVKDVMKDKYRLADKFIAVTAVLFPSMSTEDVSKLYDEFEKLKKLRDSILHGEPFLERDLPIEAMSGLLRKFILARVAASAA
jgi:hypothetical protein